MTFFNKKEEVLDIQLTQFGKHLLSTGKLKPVYYAFYDTDVLYDTTFAGFSENQNESDNRIQLATPKLKTQYCFSNIERHYVEAVEHKESASKAGEKKYLYFPNFKERSHSLSSPLGTSDLQTEKSPAWKLTFLQGEISTSQQTLLIDEHRIAIPQINLNFVTKTKVIEAEDASTSYVESPTDDPSPVMLSSDSDIFSDGSMVDITVGDLMLLVEESGVPYDRQNFEIEVFDMSSGSYMSQLRIQKDPTNIVNGLIISDTINFETQQITENCVEYYFNLNVDKNIDKNEICSALSQLKSKNILVDYDIECNDLPYSPVELNPYAPSDEGSPCPDNPDDFCE